MTVWVTIWVVLMMFWLFGVPYMTWDATKPHLLAGTIIPWACVLILGLFMFGAISPGTIR